MKIKTDPDGLIFIKSPTKEAITMNSKCIPIEEITEPILLDAQYLFEHQIIKSELDIENEDLSEIWDSIDKADLSHEIDVKYEIGDSSQEIDIHYERENSSHVKHRDVETYSMLKSEKVSESDYNLNIITNNEQLSQTKCYTNPKKFKMHPLDPKNIHEGMKNSTDSKDLTEELSTNNQCKFCNEIFENRKDMLQHQRKRCILNVYCRPQKTNQTNKKSSAAKNTRENKCKYCAKTFAKCYNARQHEMYVCKMNSKKITISSNSKNDKTYNCRYCNKRFVKQYNVNRHEIETCKNNVKNNYSKLNYESFICDYCNTAYTHKGYFRSHILKHMGFRQMYKCDFCMKSYTKKFNLKCHVASNHMKSKLYSCDYCQRKFAWRNAVKLHEKKYHSSAIKTDMCDEAISELKN